MYTALMLVCGFGDWNAMPPKHISHDVGARVDNGLLCEEPPTDHSYVGARARAIASGKPLIVWSGSAICPACVHDTEDEFVSWVGTHPSLTPNAITVALPIDGDLWRVGTITEWVVNDPVKGHVPSIRRALSNWRASRTVTAAAPVMYQPQMMMGNMMMGAGSGGCATCGSSSSGRGFFRR